MESHHIAEQKAELLPKSDNEKDGPRFPRAALINQLNADMASAVSAAPGAKLRRLSQEQVHPVPIVGVYNHQGEYDKAAKDWREEQDDLRIRELEHNNHALARELNELRFQLDARPTAGAPAPLLELRVAQVLNLIIKQNK